MGTKNLLMLKTHFDSINTRFVCDFVFGNMLWALGSLRVFVCNYVLYSFGLILKYIFRIQKGDRKNELSVHLEDSGIDGFEELVNFLFQSSEDVYSHEVSEERERETESSVIMESFDHVPEEGETEDSVSEKTDFDVSEDSKRSEGDTEGSVFMETESDVHADSKNTEDETETSVSFNREREREFSISMKTDSDFHGDCRKSEAAAEEEETERSVFMEDDSNVHEDCQRIEEETERSVLMEGDKKRDDEEEESESECPVLTTSKCQYVSGRYLSGFIEEPTTMTFSFREFYVGPYVSNTKISELKQKEDPVLPEEQEEESVREQSFTILQARPNVLETETSDKSEHNPLLQQEEEKEESAQLQSSPEFHVSSNVSETEISDVKSEHNPLLQEEEKVESVLSPEFHVSPDVSETEISRNPLLQEEEKKESVEEERRIFLGRSNSDQFSLKSEIFGGIDSSYEDDLDFNDNLFASDSESESSGSSGFIWGNSNKTDDSINYDFLAYQNAFQGFEFDTDSLKMIKKLRPEEDYLEFEPGVKNLNSLDTHYLSGKSEGDDEKKCSGNKEEKLGELDSDEEDEDEDEDDLEWEEDELVEQMKMELRNARQGGLPTILEEEEEEEEEEEKERESPKVVEYLKPLKIEEKYEYKDQMGEILKVHKCYEEKMRKLDILNYQTMHALGLLQLKDPKAKPTTSQNLWIRKAQKKSSDPLTTLVKEVKQELEVVYVGQVCLSWEILCWQHKKALELRRYDTQRSRQYNVVAGEFQLFQVLMQRFIENEPFQGPRLQNYVRNRCVIRNLLQVPAIKDDSVKDKNVDKRDEEDAIAGERLAEIIKESMRVFWDFVRADKDDTGNAFFKVCHQSKTHLKDPEISDLLISIRNLHQKKEKRLKDIVRSGNCIVRKFQKQHEDRVEVGHEQLVAQVELKLISRVLSMSKLRKDQLIWCNEKLKRITFVNRKIQVEHSFLLFPV